MMRSYICGQNHGTAAPAVQDSSSNICGQCSAAGEQCSATAAPAVGAAAAMLQLRGVQLVLAAFTKLARPVLFGICVSLVQRSKQCMPCTVCIMCVLLQPGCRFWHLLPGCNPVARCIEHSRLQIAAA
jgi:hypothetical protein